MIKQDYLLWIIIILGVMNLLKAPIECKNPILTKVPPQVTTNTNISREEKSGVEISVVESNLKDNVEPIKPTMELSLDNIIEPPIVNKIEDSKVSEKTGYEIEIN